MCVCPLVTFFWSHPISGEGGGGERAERCCSQSHAHCRTPSPFFFSHARWSISMGSPSLLLLFVSHARTDCPRTILPLVQLPHWSLPCSSSRYQQEGGIGERMEDEKWSTVSLLQNLIFLFVRKMTNLNIPAQHETKRRRRGYTGALLLLHIPLWGHVR